MKKLLKKVIAYVLLIAIITGLCPVGMKESKAATKSVSLANLGSLGTVSIGKKTKSGNWWMMKVGNNKAFCMNLGYTCHTGDVYQDKTATYNSSDSGKKGLKAHIGYWYSETMSESRKAYVLAQALFWAVEEGDTSETKLKEIIDTVKDNTGYFSGKSAGNLYKQIFENEATFNVNVTEWSYTGSGGHRQELLMIDSNTIEPLHMSVNDFYRQRIRLHKIDEYGNPMAGVQFSITTENIDELYSYQLNGEPSVSDENISNFIIHTQTDTNGWINLRITYRLQTNDYFYLTEDDLNSMNSESKKALKAQWDDMGYHYASDLTESGARELLERDLKNQFNNIKNVYKITEINSGNENIIRHPEYKNGKTVVLEQEYSWTRGLLSTDKKDWDEVIEQPYDLEVQDNYKKVALSVKKVDGYSTDTKAHGDASLDGAVFGIYLDEGCTKPAIFMKQNGTTSTHNTFEIKNGSFETDYLRCGITYYLKELKAPKGYKRKTDVTKITLNGGKYPEDVEYVTTKENITIDNQPILGKVALQKFYSMGQTGQVHPEVGAVFEVYLQKKGSYDNCNDYERDTLVIDENGYACSKNLYYGIYKIHQVSSGGQDTEKIEDKTDIIIDETGKTYTFSMNNNLFKAYLRITKKDGNTKKDVLKAGTTYQIYKLDNGKETLVTQEYSNGNKRVTVDKFLTDESGQIMTYQALNFGTYRIYETDAATGYHISTPYIEVEISSNAGNYTSHTDKDGNTYSVVTVEYTNYEAYGKLSISKKGEQLTDFHNGKFIYEEKQLKGVTFEIYAAEDIVTQDNQNTNWFNKDELVGTITTGEGAAFISECSGITGYEVDENGMVTVNLPLGKYRIKETKTLYGYILADKEWNVNFDWKNKEDTYVLNSTAVTDDKGVMNILNERAKAGIRLQKSDSDSKKGIKGVVFGIYTKDNIYNAEGKKIVDAGTRLGSLITGQNGQAVTNLDLPLMSESYSENQKTVSGAAITVTGSAVATGMAGLNSGDYFLKEEMVSGSYYLDDTVLPVHLEYQDMHTAVIERNIQKTNMQTIVEIDKKSATGGEEVPGCQLVITDGNGEEIIAWTSGKEDSVVMNPFLEQMGYQNVSARLDEKGNLIVNGLLHDLAYTLTEKRPADGFVTADSISFMLRESTDAAGSKTSIVALKNETGEYVNRADHIVTMIDETTKVNFRKQDEKGGLLGGAGISVYDSTGKQVLAFTTEKGKETKLDGVLKAGETYTFKETKAPNGFDKAKPVTYTVKDSEELQTVSMTDKKIGLIHTKTPDNFHEGSGNRTSPKTGYMQLLLILISLSVAGGATAVFARRRYYAKKIKN